MSKDKASVSIIIPTLNEETGIREVLQRIPYRELGEPEILVVDSGSSDGTIEVARSLGAKVLLKLGSSYGQALLEGLKHAKGDFLVVLDGDGVYDPREIPQMLRVMKSQNADMVSGSRYLGTIKPGSISATRLFGDRLINWVTNLILEKHFTDFYSGFRLFRKSFFRKIENRVTEPVQYSMVFSAYECHGKIVEAPITFYPRGGKAKLSSLSIGLRIFRLILRQGWREPNEC